MIECYIKECMSLRDPLESPGIMSDLSDTRKEKILKYKMPADRKRGLQAGLMIHEALESKGRNDDEIIITDNGRPTIEGMDFNVSHSGDYVMLVVSDKKVGCDIERIKDRNYSVARKYFSESEKEWMAESDNMDLAFYRIWTARESYIKLTGEGILLDFSKYEVKHPSKDEPRNSYNEKGDSVTFFGIPDNLVDGEFLGNFEVIREQKKQDVTINQWLYDNDYVVSVCCATS